MCGIVFVKAHNAIMNVGYILQGQASRGSTSCGVAYINGNELKTIKKLGNTHKFKAFLEHIKPNKRIGMAIGHNRTPSVGNGGDKNNIHPFISCDNEFALVHNGTVSSDLLRSFFIIAGHKIKGHTDSEVITHLLEEILVRTNNNRALSFNALDKLLNSSTYASYALLVLFKDGELWGIRDGEPIKIVKNGNKIFIASDEDAFHKIRCLIGKKVKVLEPKENKSFNIIGVNLDGEFDTEDVEIDDPTPKECKNCKTKDYYKCKVSNINCPYQRDNNYVNKGTNFYKNQTDRREFNPYANSSYIPRTTGYYRNGVWIPNTKTNIKKDKTELKRLRKSKGIQAKLGAMSVRITEAVLNTKDKLLKKQHRSWAYSDKDKDALKDITSVVEKERIQMKIRVDNMRIGQHPIGFRIFIYKGDTSYMYIEQTLDFEDARQLAYDYVKDHGLFIEETVRIIPIYDLDEWEKYQGSKGHNPLSDTYHANSNINNNIISDEKVGSEDLYEASKLCPECNFAMFIADENYLEVDGSLTKGKVWQCDSCGHSEPIV